jgi:hypothetical protein
LTQHSLFRKFRLSVGTIIYLTLTEFLKRNTTVRQRNLEKIILVQEPLFSSKF